MLERIIKSTRPGFPDPVIDRALREDPTFKRLNQRLELGF